MLGRPVAAAAGGRVALRTIDAVHRWRGRDASIDARTTQAVLAGQLTRAAAAVAIDGAGVTYTAPPHHPRWEMRDLLAADARTALGLRLSTDDLAWEPPALPVAPGASTMAVDAIELGTAAGSAALYYFGLDTPSGTAHRLLLGDGTSYRFYWNNGNDAVTSPPLPGPAPTVGQRVRVLGQLRADGAVRCWLSLGTSREAQDSGWSAAIGLGDGYPIGARHRVNNLGLGSSRGHVWIGDLWDVPWLRPWEALERV